MKVRGGREREALYVCCVYMPLDSTSVSVIDSSIIHMQDFSRYPSSMCIIMTCYVRKSSYLNCGVHSKIS